MDYPKLRAVSAFPVELSEGQYIYIQDPHRYMAQPVFVPLSTYFIIQFFDGKHSFADIQAAYMRQFGSTLYTEQIEQLVEQLDQCLLLDSPKFSAHVLQLRNEFAELTVRPSTHHGAAYPEERSELLAQLEQYFTDSKGPGNLPTIPRPSSSPQTSVIKAIMAPHIDINSGGPAFARAYHALAPSEADIFVILGTSHVDMHNFLALTPKAFETPLGKVETEQDFIDTLARELPYDPFEDELIHKHEHSIEFQVLFLQYLYAAQLRPAPTLKTPLKIVPILCGGSMHEAIALNHPLQQIPQLEESIQALLRVLQDFPKACLIASVDFSHIGLRYGDREAPTPETLRTVEQTDRNLLAALEIVNHERFLSQLQANRNATQVCGVVPIYTMLRLLEGTQGELLTYDRVDAGQGSVVTFASMAWWKR